VGIVSADGALHLPDFRAAERTHQLISQVAGRAGRGELPGRIVVQTMSPEHPAIRAAAAHDFERFAEQECELRAELGYPPFGRLVRVLFEDASERAAVDTAREFTEALRERLAGRPVVTLGPAPAPIALVRERHRQHTLLKLPHDASTIQATLAALRETAEATTRLRPVIDVDPSSLL